MTSFILGGGCFWCLDAVYRQLKGVTNVESGYAGGHTKSPSYYEVVSGSTGHAEVVRIIFDEVVIPADIILDAYFLSHDPTTLNRQGADVGTQYRSVMLYQDSEQQSLFEAAKDRAQIRYGTPVVTEITPLTDFYPAEPEHENYYSKNPEAAYCQVVITPKVAKARTVLKEWLKQ